MKYKVTINVYYNTPVFFEFEDRDEAMQFAMMAAEHLTQEIEGRETEIRLEAIRPEDIKAKENEDE